MNSKSTQLTIAIAIGIGLGAFATHYFVRRGQVSNPTPPPQTPVVNAPTTPSHAPQPSTPQPSVTPQKSELVVEVTASVPAKVEVSSCHETRAVTVSKSSNTMPPLSSLRLELLFSGEVVKTSLKLGNLQITQAVDDAGNDLILKKPVVPGSPVTSALPGLRPIEFAATSRALSFPFSRPGGATPSNPTVSGGTSTRNTTGTTTVTPTETKTTIEQVRLAIHLKQPLRSSQMIKELKGSVQFLQSNGTLEVKVPSVKTKEGNMIEDAVLASAKVSVGVQTPPKSSSVPDPARAVTLRVGGTRDAILKVAFIDKDGTLLKNQTSWFSPSPGIEDWTYVFEKAVSEDVIVQLTIAKDCKLTEVPFRISNLTLP